MTNGLTAYQTPSQVRCEICGGAINHPDTLLIADPTYPVCRYFECRNMLRQKSTMTPAVFKTHIEFKRKVNAERLAREARQKIRIEEVTAKELDEHRQIQQFVFNNHPGLSKNNTHLLVIPSGLSRLTPPTAERIADYTQHLHNIISQAADHANATVMLQDQHYVAHEKLAKLEKQFAENPAIHTISDRLCSMCGGGCCASGKEHAYLSAITIRRYMDKHPNESQPAIQNLYVSHIRSETVENACINQTATGCALPRELRSDICNEYYCDPLKLFQKQHAGTNDMSTVLAIQRSGNHWNQFDLSVRNDITRVALVDEATTRIMDISWDVLD